jgi:photosystem II stability/assembly factor-like uncharacterized protein
MNRILLRAFFFAVCALPPLTSSALAAVPVSWSSIGPEARISVLVVDPHNPAHLLVSGESGTTRLGVLGTDDGGTHWTPRNHGLPLQPGLPVVFALAADPDEEGVFYAGTDAGLFKSLDGGASWQRLGGAGTGLRLNGVTDIEVAPGQPRTVYVVGYRLQACPIPLCGFTYVYSASRSTTGGAHWKTLPVDGLLQRVAVAPSRPAAAYIAGKELWRTTNAGKSWLRRTRVPGVVTRDLAVDLGSPWRLWAISAKARPPRVYSSADAGATWLPADAGLPNDVTDPRAILVLSDAVLLATEDGVFLNTGKGWASLSDGLASLSVHALAADPQDPATIYAATDEGVFVATIDL